jgi:hypothetical protein
VTTYIARRSQAHQATLVGHTSQLNPAWQGRIDGATTALIHGNPGHGSGGMSPFSAGRVALATVYRSVLAQAATLAYLDVLIVLAIFTGCMVPLVLMLRRTRPGGRALAH